MSVAKGRAFTVTSLEAVAEQLLAVTVTVYVVVVVGLNVAAAALPPLLLQAYVPPPLAVRVALSPLHIATVAGVMDAVGTAVTVTNLDSVDEHPFAVTVTVYVVLVVGEKVAAALLPPLLLQA